MAQNIEIRVKQIGNASSVYFTNGVLDLADDTTLNTIIQLVDIREPDKRATNFVQTFTLPGTKRNNQTFQQIYSNGFESFAYNPTKKLDCQIIVNGNQYFSGYLQLNSIIKEREYVKGYDVTVYAKLGSFFNDLGDKKLTDLISLTEFNHPFTYWTVAQSWGYRPEIKQGSFDSIQNQTNSLTDSGGAYQYPAFTSGVVQFDLFRPGIWFGNKIVDFKLGFGYVYPLFYAGQTDPTEWTTSDFKPSLYVKTIFDKLLSSQGVSYKSQFLESEYFRRLIIPSQSYIDSNSGQVQLTDQQIKDCTVWTRFNNTGGKNPATSGGTDPVGPGPYYLLSVVGTSTGMSYGPFVVKFNDDTTAPSTDTASQYDPSTGKITIKKAGKYNLTVRLVLRLGIYIKYFGSNGAAGSFSLQGGRNIPVRADIRDANGKSVSSVNADFFIDEGDYGDASIPNNLYLDKELELSIKNDFFASGSQYYVTVSFSTTKSDYKYKTFDRTVPFWYIANSGDFNGTMKLYVYSNELSGVYNTSKGSKMILALADTGVADGDKVEMNNFIPDMKGIDLIKNLNKMFNLYWLQQPDGSFLIEPRDDFYKSSGQYVIKDWTYKVDRNQEYKIEPLYDLSSKIYSFTYDKDETYENEDYSTEYLVNYGSKKAEVESDFVDQESDVELDFVASPQIDYLDKGVYMPSFTKLEKDVRVYEKPGPRILFYGGLKPYNWKIRNLFNKSKLSLTHYGYAGHLDDPLNPRWDLNWGMCKKYYFVWNNLTEDTLFKRFWGNYIDEITDRNSHLLTVKLILSELDMINLDIRDIIQVDNVHYRINKITHNPFNSQATAELFRVKDSQSYIAKGNLVESIAPNWVPDPSVPLPPPPPPTPKPTPTPWNPVGPWKPDFELPDFGPVGEWDDTDVRPWGGSVWQFRSGVNYTYKPYNAITTKVVTGIGTDTWVNPTWRDTWNDPIPTNNYSPVRSKDIANNNSYSNMSQVSVFGRENNIAPTAQSIRIQGNRNIVSESANNISIVGNNNFVDGGISNVMVVGDNQIVTQSNVSIINGVKTNRLSTAAQRTKVQSPPNSVGVKSRVINGGINSSKACLLIQGGQDSNNIDGMPILPKQADDLVVKVGP